MKKILVIICSAFIMKSIAQEEFYLRATLDEGLLEVVSNGAVIDSFTTYSGQFDLEKTEEGDMKTPTGKYYLTKTWYLNKSAIKINYPTNQQKISGYTGTDILIHDGPSSVGCLSITSDNFFEKYFKKINEKTQIFIIPSKMDVKNCLFWELMYPEKINKINELKNIYKKYFLVHNNETYNNSKIYAIITYFDKLQDTFEVSISKNLLFWNDSNIFSLTEKIDTIYSVKNWDYFAQKCRKSDVQFRLNINDKNIFKISFFYRGTLLGIIMKDKNKNDGSAFGHIQIQDPVTLLMSKRLTNK